MIICLKKQRNNNKIDGGKVFDYVKIARREYFRHREVGNRNSSDSKK